MPDMLVKLYELPDLQPALQREHEAGIIIRRAIAPEKHIILKWVGKHFSPYWVSECDVSFANTPVTCFIAVEGERLIGFACYDATARGFFGPTGVSEADRGKGAGAALLLICLHDMYAQGYGYGIIGGVGPAEFYTKVSGAVMISDSAPGIYKGMLRE
jgi:hypothetical protein